MGSCIVGHLGLCPFTLVFRKLCLVHRRTWCSLFPEFPNTLQSLRKQGMVVYGEGSFMANGVPVVPPFLSCTTPPLTLTIIPPPVIIIIQKHYYIAYGKYRTIFLTISLSLLSCPCMKLAGYNYTRNRQTKVQPFSFTILLLKMNRILSILSNVFEQSFWA